VVKSINAVAIDSVQLQAVVVNDCSTDRTALIAEQLDCVLLDLPVNLGIGGAVQTGFRYALEHDFDYAVQVDGDGQHPANEIYKLY
jgi:glycosyltransferase involved in cell wall biosynthesis